MHSAEHGHQEVAELLLEHGARVQHENEVSRGKGAEGVPVWTRRFVRWLVCSGLGLIFQDTLNLTLNLTLTLTLTLT